MFARISSISVAAVLALFLAACAQPVKVQYDQLETKREPLAITLPVHLELEPLRWRVVEVDGKPAYALNSQGYEALSRNIEKTQNNLWVYRNIVIEYQKYYEGASE